MQLEGKWGVALPAGEKLREALRWPIPGCQSVHKTWRAKEVWAVWPTGEDRD